MDFYRAFEEKHRGSRDLIMSRLKVYLPFLEPLKDIYPEPQALDLGCGRGEWLELMGEHGFRAEGVDLDEGMLEACQQRNLNAYLGCALDCLKALPNESQAIVSGFHIAEHIPFNDLQTLVEESLRVLKPAGLLILETPNPENIVVGSSGFYIDPTHKKPLPPLLLSFLPEYYGFESVKIVRLQEPEGIFQKNIVTLSDVLYGVSPDYAIVAQKTASPKLKSIFNSAFKVEYGVSFNDLSNRYEDQTEVFQSQILVLVTELAEVKSQLDEIQKSHQRWENLCSEYEHELQKIRKSTSWKVTAPLRALKDQSVQLQQVVSRKMST